MWVNVASDITEILRGCALMKRAHIGRETDFTVTPHKLGHCTMLVKKLAH